MKLTIYTRKTAACDLPIADLFELIRAKLSPEFDIHTIEIGGPHDRSRTAEDSQKREP